MATTEIEGKPVLIASCMSVCPQGTDVRTLLGIIAQVEHRGRPKAEAFEEAWRLVTTKNPFPATCGRVCPHPCESQCNRTDHDCAVAINNVERYIGDWGIAHGLQHKKLTETTHPERVAVIGSGPAGLSCAYHLAKWGYHVTVFEAFPQPGGMLRYGIPAYRLPRHILDAEIQKILDLGVELRTNMAVGRDVTLESLQQEYASVFVGIGAQKGTKLRVAGENCQGVFTGLDFLRMVNSGQTVKLGRNVIVVGGGNTALDAARVARRLQADVTILYRRTRAEMPASAAEITGAEEEGILLKCLAAPIEIQSEDGCVSKVICQRMTLGEADASGRPKPIPIPDDTFILYADNLILAVSQEVDWSGLEGIKGLESNISLDDPEVLTRGGLYSGGDVQGLGLVAEALREGRKAAEAMHAKFRGIDLPLEPEKEVVRADRLNMYVVEKSPRHDCQHLPAQMRLNQPWTETTQTLSEEEVIREAARCVSCGESFIKHPKTHPVHLLRRFSQIGIGTLLFNSYWSVIATKIPYGGPLRSVCFPGLNCHSCPTALLSCPIGMLQHFSATHHLPWFLIGFVSLIGLISGRFACGWLCPWGVVQDLLYKFKKLSVHIPIVLNYFKYAVLVGVCIILPYITFEHWFSKLCPCGGLIAGIPWVLWNPMDPILGIPTIEPGSVGAMFTIKMLILGTFLLMFLVIKRPFCRTVCPLGAIYALFNRISLVSIKVKESCTDCGQCRAVCPTDLEVRHQVNSENCVKCLECTQCKHIKFQWNLPWKQPEKVRRKAQTVVEPAWQPTPAMPFVNAGEVAARVGARSSRPGDETGLASV